jgi:DNA-binding GntR family transcriptional regulator
MLDELAELAHGGLVVTRQGSGVFVAGHGGPGYFEVAEAVRADLASSGPSTSWAPRDSNATSGASPSGSAPTPPNSR